MKLTYAAAAGLTLTLNGLANGAGRQATAVDNTANGYLDVQAVITIKTAAGSLGNPTVLTVYAYGSEDGATWPDGITGTDGGWTAPTTITGRVVGVVPTDAAATARTLTLASIANAFGGVLPAFWTLAVVNATGLALDGAAGGSVNYRGVTTA